MNISHFNVLIDFIKTNLDFKGVSTDLMRQYVDDAMSKTIKNFDDVNIFDVTCLFHSYRENDHHILVYGDAHQMLISKETSLIMRNAIASRSPTCDCGAKHTSFPSQHYNWCSLKKGLTA